MLNYKVKIGETIFPNKLLAFNETDSQLTGLGHSTSTIPYLRIRMANDPSVSLETFKEAAKSGNVIEIIDPDNDDMVIFRATSYPVYGVCERALENTGMVISLTMYNKAILDLTSDSGTTIKSTVTE